VNAEFQNHVVISDLDSAASIQYDSNKGVPSPSQRVSFEHSYSFDPTYGYSLDRLLQVEAPAEPADFCTFWTERRARIAELDPRTKLRQAEIKNAEYEVFYLSYRSSGGLKIRGWAAIPKHRPVVRAMILGHGYSGDMRPDLRPLLDDAVCIYPCFRGLGRSVAPPYSDIPDYHVTHDIHRKDLYVLGGCVEDLWMAVSATLALFPAVEGRIGYMGISFSGGVGALALPWEPRIQRAHLNIPSFGHHPLRVALPTVGSTRGLAAFVRLNPGVMANLPYFDAAVATRHIKQPMHVAAAKFDPVVAPPSQFAIYNAITAEKTLFVLEAGHFEHSEQQTEDRRLRAELQEFFASL